MCTVVVLRDTVPGMPLVVAANRDELYARPTDGPRRDGGVILSGVDRVAGGAWMGATAGGLVVALTNQRTWQSPDPSRRSRGQVVLDALAAGTREGVRARVSSLDPSVFNGFHLIYGDATGGEVAYVRPGEPVEIAPLPTGVSVIANDRIGSPEFPRAERAAAEVARIASRPWPAVATALAGVLADHTMPPPERTPPAPAGSLIAMAGPDAARRVQALCIHTDRYGTRSATIAAVTPRGLGHYLVSLDAPCISPLSEQWG
jgi:uncharacterized protein with NRDE domain